MNIEDLRSYCVAMPDVTEDMPFGESTLVFRVGVKIFLLVSLESSPLQFNAKCDPDRAIALRDEHSSIIPGYHMNKKHWNTIICDGALGEKLIKELVKHSYELVAAAKKKTRNKPE